MAPLDVLMHIRRARAAGDLAQASLAQRVLAGHAKPIAFKAAKKQLRSVDDAEDIAQVAMIEAMSTKLDSTKLGAWEARVRTIAKRRAIDHLRRLGPRERTETVTPDYASDPDAPHRELIGAPDIDLDSPILAAAIDACLERLCDAHKKVAILGLLRDASADEIAIAVPGMSENNAYQIVSRFKKSLRAELGG